ncbi:hypothetical protein EDD18DRAFT_1135311, partial [Armillaria luteobubalina]
VFKRWKGELGFRNSADGAVCLRRLRRRRKRKSMRAAIERMTTPPMTPPIMALLWDFVPVLDAAEDALLIMADVAEGDDGGVLVGSGLGSFVALLVVLILVMGGNVKVSEGAPLVEHEELWASCPLLSDTVDDVGGEQSCHPLYPRCQSLRCF